ncbi:hypothetical protein D3C72_445080 [compost metagenome]
MEQRKNLWLLQLLEFDCPTRAIAAIVTVESHPDLKAMPNIAGEQEGRAPFREVNRIFLGLGERLLHGFGPAHRPTNSRALGLSGLASLFGFDDEVAALVDVNEAGRRFAVSMLDDYVLFKDVVVAFPLWLWRLNTQNGTQLNKEQVLVRSFAGARAFPTMQEVLNPLHVEVGR